MKVSVIVPTCGRYQLLQQSIESIHRQTYDDVEIVVVIDGDAYNQEQLNWIEDNADIMVGVRPGRLDKHVAVAINHGMDVCNGDVVAYLGDDNIYINNDRIQAAIDMLTDNGHIAVVDTVRWIRIDGIRQPQSAIGRYQYRRPYEDGHDNLISMISENGSNFVVHDCVIHWKTALRYRTELKYNDKRTPTDWEYWCRLSQMGDFKCHDVVGVEAFMPGAWRSGGLTIDDAIRIRGGDMSKVRYARNISGKIQIISRVSGVNDEYSVPVDGLIPLKYVMSGDGQLYPGFVRDWNDAIENTVAEINDASGNQDSSDDVVVVDEVEPTLTRPIVVDDRPVECNTDFDLTEDTIRASSYGELLMHVNRCGLQPTDMKKSTLVSILIENTK